MSVDGGNGVLKTLVDSLANTLTKLSVRQESIEKDVSKIELAVSHIPEINRVLADIKIDQKLVGEAMDKISEAIQEVSDLARKERSEIKSEIQPVSKLAELLRKPLSVIVSLLILITAALGLFKVAEDSIDRIFNKQQPAINAPAQTNQVNTVP